jgi:hypothetical protein
LKSAPDEVITLDPTDPRDRLRLLSFLADRRAADPAMNRELAISMRRLPPKYSRAAPFKLNRLPRLNRAIADVA